MAGLVPAIHVLFVAAPKSWMPGCERAFTPVFDGLWPGMTILVLRISPTTHSLDALTSHPYTKPNG
jgi:hypothetical protein